jgi:acyl-homoserine-lactone acylase
LYPRDIALRVAWRSVQITLMRDRCHVDGVQRLTSRIVKTAAHLFFDTSHHQSIPSPLLRSMHNTVDPMNLSLASVRRHTRCAAWMAGLAAALLAAFGSGDAAARSDPTRFSIVRNAVGVPHVQAASLEGVAKGLGYAYAADNFCLLQDQVITVNGDRSRWFGPTHTYPIDPLKPPVANLEADFFYRFTIDSNQARAVHESADANTRALFRGYLAGINGYFSATPAEQIDPACRTRARALTDIDLYRLLTAMLTRATSAAFFQQLATPPALPTTVTAASPQADAPQLPQLPHALASNGWAFGRDVVDPAQGRSLLFGNPHFPLAGFERFYEARLTVPGQLDTSGVTLMGLPLIAIGYNKDLAWTHTVSTARRFTLHELALKPGDPLTYLVDGVEKPIVPVDVTVPLPANYGRPASMTRRYYRTEFGPLFQFPHPQIGLVWSTTRAYALQDVNLDNNRAVSSWLAAGQSRSVNELRTALGALRGIPYVNTIAADRRGEVLYGDLSAVPAVEASTLQTCKPSAVGQAWLSTLAIIVLDGSKATCHWGRPEVPAEARLLPADRLPSVVRTDFVANSNDSYWLANPGHSFASDLSPILGLTGVPQSLRTRAGLQLIQDRLAAPAPHAKISAEAIKTLWARNDNHAASLVLDDLLAMVAASGSTVVTASNGHSVDAAQALTVLTAWDRTSRSVARGAVLFREVWTRLAKDKSIFAVPFDPQQPQTTPRGLAANKRAVVSAALGDAILALRAQGIAVDAMLGAVQYVQASGKLQQRLPISGGEEIEGVLNKTASQPMVEGRYLPAQGTSYVQFVTLGERGARAEGWLGYSQSTDPRSPHVDDQLPLWSRLQTRRLPTLP